MLVGCTRPRPQALASCQPCRRPASGCISNRTPQLRNRIIFLSSALGLCTAAAYFVFTPSRSRSAPSIHDQPISASHFTPAVICSSELTGPNTKLISLSVHPHLLPPRNSPVLKPIWSVFIKDDDIQVERPYTPLYTPDSDGRLTFWIKRYPHGEVGRWLHSKNVGDAIELRGPLKTWQWKEDVWDEIIMVCVSTLFNGHVI